MTIKKVTVKIIANVDSQEFTLDEEQLPDIVEDVITEVMHDINGIQTKDVTVRTVK
tara:strand:+ start:4475 stop:4642 length:168 start_codon:yes stop_codon:yes gene_type:complete